MFIAHDRDIAEVRIWDLNGISEVLCMYFKAGNLVLQVNFSIYNLAIDCYCVDCCFAIQHSTVRADL